jgi:hypothetical protein
MPDAPNTVADLIKLLEAVQDKSLPVVLEGCDCSWWWSGEATKEKFLGETPSLELERRK